MSISSVCLLLMFGLNRYDVAGQSSGDLRVIGFNSDDRKAGRLEMYYNGEWGTICDDGFDDNDAQVACKQLVNRPVIGKTLGHVGAGTGTIWLDDVGCSGTESRLSYCSHNGLGTHNCQHTKDVSILCSVEQAVHGSWGCWSGSTNCNVTCGRGTQHRNRICDSPSPKNGGNSCIGNSIEHLACNVFPCPVNGGWSIWSNWTDCTNSCGGGLQTRIRHCNNPLANHGGDYCSGNATDATLCNTVSCAVNGGWSIWSNWTDCTNSCGGGLQTRIRHCNNPLAKHGGDYCYGNVTEARLCDTLCCAVNGSWSIWSNWTDCNGGLQTRIRHCNNPLTVDGGDYCHGNATEARLCNIGSYEACKKYSLQEVVGVASGCTVVTLCITLIGVCIYNKSIGSRKDLGIKVVTQETSNEYILNDLGHNDNATEKRTQDDVYEETDNLYENA